MAVYPDDGTHVRWKKGDASGVGVVVLIWLAEDVPCVDVLDNEGRRVSIFQELGDELAVI